MKTESNENILPTEYIQNLVNNYRENQLACINTNLNMDDAHSIWFNLATLKSFIAEIEAQAADVDPNVSDADLGIRFYYGAYPEFPEQPIPEDYAKRHTLVLVPTKKEDGLNYDFNPFAEPSSLAVTALAQNHGSLVPPNPSIVESY